MSELLDRISQQRARRRQRAAELRQLRRGDAFSPTSISAVVGWLRVANATVPGGTFTVPDLFGGPSATQATALNHPTIGTSANGLPILQFGGSAFLFHALSASVNNHADYFGCGMWFRSPLSAANRFPYAMRATTGGTGVHRLNWQIVTTEDILSEAFIDNNNQRRARTAVNIVGDNVWQFHTIEFQGSLTGDARMILTRDNVSLSLTYSGLGPSPPSEFPATLRTTTGNALIGASTNVPGNPFTGDMGPNIFFFSRQLTSVERGNLMAFDQPS